MLDNMKDTAVPIKTRKRRRNLMTLSATRDRGQASSSWSSLVWMFAAAAIAASSPSASSSTASWAVRGQPHGPTADPESDPSNLPPEQQQQEPHETSQLRKTTPETAKVRGGRGDERGGRAFVRQKQHHHNDGEARNRNKLSGSDNNNNPDDPDASLHHEPPILSDHHQQDRFRAWQLNHAHEDFLAWCQGSMGIDTSLVEIDHFGYPDYLRAMEDRIDIFCDDCFGEDGNNNNEYNGDTSMDNKSNSQNSGLDNETKGDDQNSNDAKESSNVKDDNRSTKRKTKFLDDDDRYLSVTEEYPPVSVRGLKASRNIAIGEVVLSIPHSALWTVYNVIDTSGDPILLEAMGPQARQIYGWESPGMDEIPLLAITLLYHMDQAKHESSDHAPYLEILSPNANNLKESIPHLWSSRKLRKSATPSVRLVAKGIRQDVVELYESIVEVLIEHHPDVFGNKGNGKENPAGSVDDSREDEWMFSLENFHWAFALVNSRHWHLQIPDDPNQPIVEEKTDSKTQEASSLEKEAQDRNESDVHQDTAAAASPRAPPLDDDHESFTDQEGPPAATPTDEWVVIQDQKLREEEERESKRFEDEEDSSNASSSSSTNGGDPKESGGVKSSSSNNNNAKADEEEEYWPPGNSFLAPLADLLNFGPPCTRGIYNSETQAFEIIATCAFSAGQEITFWYTDACEDVFVANYGFAMPDMVPKCTSYSSGLGGDTTKADPEGSGKGSMVWQQQQQEHHQQYLEDELSYAYEELDRLDHRLDFLMGVLEDCHCGNQTELLAGAWDEPNHNSRNGGKGSVDKTPGKRSESAKESSSASTGHQPGNPIPRSPSPPTHPEPGRGRSSSNNNNRDPSGRKNNAGDAQHAIRNRGGSFKGAGHPNSSNNGNRHHHHHRRNAMTRTRSRHRPNLDFEDQL